eukprot:EG_transcript_11895
MPFVAFYVLLAECKILTDPLPPELPPECPELQPGTFGKCMALLERRSTPSPARNHAGFVDRFLGLNLWCCAHQLQHFQNPPPEGMGQPLTAAKVRAMQHQMSNADCGYATFFDIVVMLTLIKAPHPWICLSKRVADFALTLAKAQAKVAPSTAASPRATR